MASRDLAGNPVSYKRQKFIQHVVSANEQSSGLVRLPVINANNVTNPSGDIIALCQVRSSIGTEKTGFKLRYVKPSGILLVDTGSFATSDVITILLTFV